MPRGSEVDDEELELEDDNLYNDDSGDGNDNEDELGSIDPALQRNIQKLLDEREAALSQDIATGKTKHPVYKEIQKTLAKEQNTRKGLETRLEQALSALEQQSEVIAELTDGLNWASETMLNEMPDDSKQTALGNLRARQVNRANDEIKKLKAGGNSANNSRQRGNDSDPPQWVLDGIAEFKENSAALAKLAGVEDDDDRLDYGEDDDALVKRQSKFRKSLELILKEDEDVDGLDKVRQRTRPVATRSGSGAGVGAPTQRRSLEDISAELRKQLIRVPRR